MASRRSWRSPRSRISSPSGASTRTPGFSPSRSTAMSCAGRNGLPRRSLRAIMSRSSVRFRAAELLSRSTGMDDPLLIAGTKLRSRLFVGASGYPNQQVLLDSLKASGAELVTASIRRISLEGYAESLIDLLGGRYRLLPNTAGCVTARDAVLTAELAREALETNWVKLELIGDRET